MNAAVFVFDGVNHELVKIVEDRGEYLAYRLKDVLVSTSGKTFNFESEPHASWGYKPYEDADVVSDPAVYFDDVILTSGLNSVCDHRKIDIWFLSGYQTIGITRLNTDKTVRGASGVD